MDPTDFRPREGGVKIVGHANVPGRLAATASSLYARNLHAFVETLILRGEREARRCSEEVEMIRMRDIADRWGGGHVLRGRRVRDVEYSGVIAVWRGGGAGEREACDEPVEARDALRV